MVTLEEFKKYISALITNPSMVKKPINKNGNNYWMVTTDLDNTLNKEEYLKNVEIFEIKDNSIIKK